MMKHYLEIKDKYKDCIIFYRLGDFYEMFFDDAIRASSLLELTLTGRDCGLKERAPMCGVPFHAAEGYIAKLVSLGEKVAICEQLSDPKASKGMVERDVIRVVTAGTVTDDNSLSEKENNYICSVLKNNATVAVAWADITTGELCASEFAGADVVKSAVNHLMKLGVKEIISNDEMLFAVKDLPEVKKGLLPPFSSYPGWAFNFAAAHKSILTQLNTKSLSAFSIDGKNDAICAIGALIEYLKETQKHTLANIDSVKYVLPASCMQLDMTAVRNLELVKSIYEGKKYGTLLWVLDKTCTGMGARLLLNLLLAPLKSVNAINHRLDGVEELYNATVVRVGIIELLNQVKDVERLTGKISNDKLAPIDCRALAQSLLVVPNLKFRLTGFSSRVLGDISKGLYDLSDIANEINSAIIDDRTPPSVKDGGYIKEGYNAQLDELRSIKKSATKVLGEMEVRERDVTGIRTLKIGYNRVFGYYIEVSKSFKDKVPTTYHRRQTLANAERYTTDELKQLEEKILNSDERAFQLEAALYAELKDKLMRAIPQLKSIADAIAKLDVLTAFAEVSKSNNYVRPKIVESNQPMIIKEGRHPVVEVIAKEKFVANDTLLDESENRTLIITGPNMAGKSTYMRQNAIIAIMAHVGCFVPAKSAQIPIIDRVFTRVGASDNLIFDQSTFMVEMIEVASILQNATKDSLLILDEVGRGTSTYDGLSIAWAVIEHITEKIGAKTLFATHYHELLQLENKLEGVKNYKIAVKDFNGSIVFLRKIMRGGANRSFGIEVASLAGVPACVTDRAKNILKAVESGDVTTNIEFDEQTEEVKEVSEVERILKDVDLNNMSPMQAFMILSDLVEKVK
ncbi:MAG: DNA mismatch repair protein MutS [Clostridia bacterium]|nr:DNA mismatch repair protein MutS [Clostridia bacterium]